MYRFFKTVFIIFLTANIILYSDRSTAAALAGLNLWLNTIVPSLFPFMVISSWLTFSPAKKNITAIQKLLGIPSGLFPIFFVSLLSGYPMGAKITAGLLKEKQISADTAEHLLAFCNNCGIVFIISVSAMLGDRFSACYFIFVCTLASLITGIVYNVLFPAKYAVLYPKNALGGGILSALSSAVSSILMVGGSIIFFSVVAESIMNVLPTSNMFLNGLISGVLEFTRGIKIISVSGFGKKAVYPAIASMLCWGGLSVHLQSAAVMAGSGADIKKYIACKAFCASVGYFLAYFSFGLFFTEAAAVPVFSQTETMPSAWALSSAFAIFVIFIKKLRKS